MSNRISKSAFKARALEYFRRVQQSGEPLIITDRGKPVLRLVPYDAEPDPDTVLASMRGTLERYVDPLEPIGLADWETLR